MHWLIEPEVFKEDVKPLLESLEKTKTPYTLCKFGMSYDDCILQMYREPIASRNIVFYGSFQFSRKANGKIRVFGKDLSKFACNYYYPQLGANLLNYDYVMIPAGDFERKKLRWFDHNWSLFVRPNSVDKVFTGKVVTVSSENNIPKTVSPDTLLVVAPTQNIIKEWRMIVIDKEVVTGGQYKENGKIVRVEGPPNKVYNYAQEVVSNSNYNPDVAWTLDICETEYGELKVLEVGPFSCSGLYACDTTEIVKRIGRIYENFE